MEESNLTNDLIKKTAELILDSNNLVVLTGAGVSTESGIPDFRSPKSGLWEKISLEESKYIFSDPKIFKKIVQELGPKIVKAKPNKTHKVLAQFHELGILKTLITQNIDGLHQKAKNHLVLELHGNATEFICTLCHSRFKTKKILKKMKSLDENTITLPSCTKCGASIFMDIILFDQPLHRGIFYESVSSAQKSDVFLVIGSSLMVYPANTLPNYALEYGAKLIIINNEKTDFDPRANIVLRGQAGKIMSKILEVIKKKQK